MSLPRLLTQQIADVAFAQFTTPHMPTIYRLAVSSRSADEFRRKCNAADKWEPGLAEAARRLIEKLAVTGR